MNAPTNSMRAATVQIYGGAETARVESARTAAVNFQNMMWPWPDPLSYRISPNFTSTDRPIKLGDGRDFAFVRMKR